MKKRIDFDVEKAKSGVYQVVTRDGRPARIICWDKIDGGNYCIVALVRNKVGNEITMTYREDGLSNDHFRDDSVDLYLEVDVELLELLTDFEYKVGDLMYGGYIDEINEEGLACVQAKARELMDIAIMEYENEKFFESSNYDNDRLRTDLGELLKIALRGQWQDSEKSGISNVRYSVQGGVIYDCAGGKEILCNKVIDVVVNALNYRGEEDCELKKKREKVERVGRIRKSLTTNKLEGRTSNRAGL